MIKKVLEQFMIRLDNMYLPLGPDLVHAIELLSILFRLIINLE